VRKCGRGTAGLLCFLFGGVFHRLSVPVLCRIMSSSIVVSDFAVRMRLCQITKLHRIRVHRTPACAALYIRPGWEGASCVRIIALLVQL